MDSADKKIPSKISVSIGQPVGALVIHGAPRFKRITTSRMRVSGVRDTPADSRSTSWFCAQMLAKREYERRTTRDRRDGGPGRGHAGRPCCEGALTPIARVKPLGRAAQTRRSMLGPLEPEGATRGQILCACGANRARKSCSTQIRPLVQNLSIHVLGGGHFWLTKGPQEPARRAIEIAAGQQYFNQDPKHPSLT